MCERSRFRGAIWTLVALLLGGCQSAPADRVVVYTSLDQTLSSPIFEQFTASTGIEVAAVYDTEAAKTTGLVNRLMEEASRPRADVFWNSEIARTIVLKRRGILEAYRSPVGEGIPSRFKDPEGYWTGFAARCRVLVVNTDLVPEESVPTSIFDPVEDGWRSSVVLGNPMFGTTATHAAALFSALGPARAKDYYRQLAGNGVAIVAGNAASKDAVARGTYRVGFTDTDDALIAMRAGEPVVTVYPDQDGIGAFVIPNTICLVKGGPNPLSAKMFIDYVLSEDVERELAFGRGGQIPVRASVEVPEGTKSLGEIHEMEVDYEQMASHLEESTVFLRDLFSR